LVPAGLLAAAQASVPTLVAWWHVLDFLDADAARMDALTRALVVHAAVSDPPLRLHTMLGDTEHGPLWARFHEVREQLREHAAAVHGMSYKRFHPSPWAPHLDSQDADTALAWYVACRDGNDALGMRVKGLWWSCRIASLPLCAALYGRKHLVVQVCSTSFQQLQVPLISCWRHVLVGAAEGGRSDLIEWAIAEVRQYSTIFFAQLLDAWPTVTRLLAESGALLALRSLEETARHRGRGLGLTDWLALVAAALHGGHADVIEWLDGPQPALGSESGLASIYRCAMQVQAANNHVLAALLLAADVAHNNHAADVVAAKAKNAAGGWFTTQCGIGLARHGRTEGAELLFARGLLTPADFALESRGTQPRLRLTAQGQPHALAALQWLHARGLCRAVRVPRDEMPAVLATQ
jgi:hypothetical protein